MFRNVLRTHCLRMPVASSPLQQIRFAGGGGRPGGKPTFNWREKMALRLARRGDKKQKPLKITPSGDWDDLEAYFDEAKGDMMTNITKLDEFEFPETKKYGKFEGPNDTRKQIDNFALFGPSKRRGIIVKKYKPRDAKNFSHSRVFGHKNNAE